MTPFLGAGRPSRVLKLADGGAAELVRLRPALQADYRPVGGADVVVRFLGYRVYSLVICIPFSQF